MSAPLTGSINDSGERTIQLLLLLLLLTLLLAVSH